MPFRVHDILCAARCALFTYTGDWWDLRDRHMDNGHKDVPYIRLPNIVSIENSHHLSYIFCVCANERCIPSDGCLVRQRTRKINRNQELKKQKQTTYWRSKRFFSSIKCLPVCVTRRNHNETHARVDLIFESGFFSYVFILNYVSFRVRFMCVRMRLNQFHTHT